ncbi:MAG TPA: hypothetical protein VI282_15640 [Verrucomicrobiae bacterium]
MKIKSLFAAFLFVTIGNAADLAWRYQLLEGSYLMDDCLICGRPSFNIPMRGSFTLRRVEVSPVATKYVIENADFKAGPDYSFSGSGTYTTSGDFVIKQSMTLSGELQTTAETKQVALTNETSAITRRWPMLFATLKQTNGTLASTITLTIAAAPLQEIWFSTSTNFTRAIKIDNSVSDGDLLSTIGHIVKRNSDFQTNFPGPTFLNMGLDAVDILPGAEIAFSTGTKGVLSDGDFAFANTGAITRWQDFMNIVAPDLTSDPGLDALQFDGPNKIYFSTRQDIAAAVGPIGNGDIILIDTEAGTGDVFRSNADLLSQFHPSEAKDYGLDALYIWPTGEIWFSTTNDFSDTQLGPISAGDLLSDAGYIVYRNAGLIAALQPVGAPPPDVGLDALVVISDFVADESKTTLKASLDTQNDAVILSWQGQGRVFRLERARDIAGPWEGITSIVPAFSFEDTDNITQQQRAFYRVRQW